MPDRSACWSSFYFAIPRQICSPSSISWERQSGDFLQGGSVQTSLIQRLPFARRMFRHYLGLMPIAIQQLDLSGYDLMISSNHAVAKGVLTGPDQLHVSYVHSPMRYAWDLQHQYLEQTGMDRGLRGMYARWLLARMRQWDVLSANHVDYFLANPAYIARRIRKTYRREAAIIHPPVDLDRFVPCADKGDFFLLACRFVPTSGRNRSRELRAPACASPSGRRRRAGERTGARGCARSAEH